MNLSVCHFQRKAGFMVAAGLLAQAFAWGAEDLAELVNAAGSEPATVAVTTTCEVISDLTVPTNITLQVTPEGRILIYTNVVLSIAGSLEAAPQPLFEGPGKAVCMAADPGVYPQWFGAVTDDEEDDAFAVEHCLTYLSSKPSQSWGEIRFPPGEYRMNRAMVYSFSTKGSTALEGLYLTNIWLRGDPSATVAIGTNHAGFTDFQVWAPWLFDSCVGMRVSDLNFSLAGLPPRSPGHGAYMLAFQNCSSVLVERCEFAHMPSTCADSCGLQFNRWTGSNAYIRPHGLAVTACRWTDWKFGVALMIQPGAVEDVQIWSNEFDIAAACDALALSVFYECSVALHQNEPAERVRIWDNVIRNGVFFMNHVSNVVVTGNYIGGPARFASQVGTTWSSMLHDTVFSNNTFMCYVWMGHAYSTMSATGTLVRNVTFTDNTVYDDYIAYNSLLSCAKAPGWHRDIRIARNVFVQRVPAYATITGFSSVLDAGPTIFNPTNVFVENLWIHDNALVVDSDSTNKPGYYIRIGATNAVGMEVCSNRCVGGPMFVGARLDHGPLDFSYNFVEQGGLQDGASGPRIGNVYGGTNDVDHDGLPDWWELRQGSDTSNTLADADGDGDDMDNLTEYVLDSAPGAWTALPELVLGLAAEGRWTLRTGGTPSSPVRLYDLQFRTNLLSGAWSSLSLTKAGGIGGESVVLQELNSGTMPTSAFYRLTVRVP